MLYLLVYPGLIKRNYRQLYRRANNKDNDNVETKVLKKIEK